MRLTTPVINVTIPTMNLEIKELLLPYLQHLDSCVWDVQDDPHGCTCDLNKQLEMIQSTIDTRVIRTKGLEKIIDTAELYIPDADLCTYYESLDEI